MVARVNAAFITQDQLDEAVRATNQPVTPALITSVKNQLVAREVFRQAAQQAHYDTRPQVVEAVNQARTAAMITAYLRDEVKAPTITDADVKAKYTEIVSSLGQYEFKPSVIEVKDAAVATMVLGQLKKGGDFAQLAKQYSQGPGAAQGGTLTWVSFKTPIQAGQTQNWPQPLAEALVKLPEGALSSEPVKVGETYWILRVEQKRATQVPPFDQIKVALHEQLERAAIEKATASIAVNLIKNASIQQ
jgi:parvulin-like peptidyl-prolyl isomerase